MLLEFSSSKRPNDSVKEPEMLYKLKAWKNAAQKDIGNIIVGLFRLPKSLRMLNFSETLQGVFWWFRLMLDLEFRSGYKKDDREQERWVHVTKIGAHHINSFVEVLTSNHTITRAMCIFWQVLNISDWTFSDINSVVNSVSNWLNISWLHIDILPPY